MTARYCGLLQHGRRLSLELPLQRPCWRTIHIDGFQKQTPEHLHHLRNSTTLVIRMFRHPRQVNRTSAKYAASTNVTQFCCHVGTLLCVGSVRNGSWIAQIIAAQSVGPKLQGPSLLSCREFACCLAPFVCSLFRIGVIWGDGGYFFVCLFVVSVCVLSLAAPLARQVVECAS